MAFCFSLCRLWMLVLLNMLGVVLVVILFVLFVVFHFFKHTISELIEEKVFNVCNYWEFQVLFFHAFISEQIILNYILPKYHFSKSSNRHYYSHQIKGYQNPTESTFVSSYTENAVWCGSVYYYRPLTTRIWLYFSSHAQTICKSNSSPVTPLEPQ